jgi:hypothetical protein
MSEWNYHFILCTIPEYSRSQNMFNFSVPFHQENGKWCSLILLHKMSTTVKSHDLPVKELVLLSLLDISVVGSKVSSYLKTTIHEAFNFWYHINKIHTQINQCAVIAKILSQPGIHLCVTSTAVQSWQTDFHGLHERLPLDCSTFMYHLNTDHTCDRTEIRKIFQLHYGTINQSPSKQICKCIATGGTVIWLHAVQQCGCKIIQREWMWCFWWLCYTVW